METEQGRGDDESKKAFQAISDVSELNKEKKVGT